MHIEAVKSVLARKPFRPIEIHTASGEVYKVVHPESVMQSAGGHTLVLATGGETIAIIDVALIADIATAATARKPKGPVK